MNNFEKTLEILSEGYVPLKTKPRYIPNAIYTLGVNSITGHQKKTIEVKADSKGEAIKKGNQEVKYPDTVVYISTAPNPEHVAYTKKIQKELTNREK